jgi:thymidylate synthase (FAD)
VWTEDKHDIEFPLEDNIGYIKLINYNSSEYNIATIAAQSYLKSDRTYTGKQIEKIITKLLTSNPRHLTPFEFCTIKFRVKAPVCVWWHWTRHRSASYLFQSGRRTKLEDIYNPFDREEVTELLKHSVDTYNKLIDDGCRLEHARSVLPFYLMYYEAYVSMNLRSIINFLEQRDDINAQYEIRAYARSMRSILKNYFPTTMGNIKKD